MKRQHILWIVAGMIFFGALARLIPHMNNFAPIGALALLGGAIFTRKGWGIALPILAYVLSDFVLSLTNVGYPFLTDKGFLFQRVFDYGAMVLISLLGMRLSGLMPSTATYAKVGGSAFLSSGIFFLISNFAVWFSGIIFGGESMYSSDVFGLIHCYQMGLPFYKGTFYGDLLYSGLFFGSYYALFYGKMQSLSAHES
jgi:hypothetical protein